jgi:hypothetical protein
MTVAEARRGTRWALLHGVALAGATRGARTGDLQSRFMVDSATGRTRSRSTSRCGRGGPSSRAASRLPAPAR